MPTSDASKLFVSTSLYTFSLLCCFSKLKPKNVVLCLELLKKYYGEVNFQIISVYEPLFLLLFDENELLSSRNHVILVNSMDFKTYHYRWTLLKLRRKHATSERFCMFIPSSKIPSKRLVMNNCLLHSMKLSLCVPPSAGLSNVQMKLEQWADFSPPEAKKVVLSFFTDNVVLSTGELTKLCRNYLITPRYLREKDVYSLYVKHYSDSLTDDLLYFRVNGLESENSQEYHKTYLVTESTAIFDETARHYFLPSRQWEVLEPQNMYSISPILPLGLENYHSTIFKWFQPFLQDLTKDLMPVFALFGPSGVGKTVLLEAVCSSLGIYFMKMDCNNIISNTTTQIKSNIKNIFKSALEHSPVLLQLSFAELLSTEKGGNDPDQLVDMLKETVLETQLSCGKVMVVFTCQNAESLGAQLHNLSLQSLQMESPSEVERKRMLCWLSHRFRIRLSDDALTYASAETHAYTMADLTRMLKLSQKHLVETDETDILEKIHIKQFIDSVKDKGGIGEVDWEDVGGVDRLKKEVLGSLLSSRLMPGLERRGLLLHGPPGTGKTLLARAVATQCSRAFIPVKGPELLNMYVGQSEANIRQVFARAREASPSIVFFDELDSLAPNRGNKSDSGGVMDRVVSQLLAEMDGLDSSGDVFILAATNRPDLIDPALLRPGRFDKLLYVGPCEDPDSKCKVLKAITRKFKFEENLCLEELVPLLPNQVTGANLYALCSSAWMEAAREIISSNSNVVLDFYWRLGSALNGPTFPGITPGIFVFPDDPDKPKNSPVIVRRDHFEAALKTVKMC